MNCYMYVFFLHVPNVIRYFQYCNKQLLLHYSITIMIQKIMVTNVSLLRYMYMYDEVVRVRVNPLIKSKPDDFLNMDVCSNTRRSRHYDFMKSVTNKKPHPIVGQQALPSSARHARVLRFNLDPHTEGKVLGTDLQLHGCKNG